MKKLKIVILMVLTIFFMNIVNATTITVCASGCDNTTIQSALNIANEHDVVYVYNGTYNENIAFVTNNVTLQGEKADPPVINGYVRLTSYYARIDSFIVQNSTEFGIRIERDHGVISNTTIRNSNEHGITREGAGRNNQTIKDSLIEYSGSMGIYFGWTDNVKIINVTSRNNTNDGIKLEVSNYAYVSNSSFYNNGGKGGHFTGNRNPGGSGIEGLVIEYNDFYNNTQEDAYIDDGYTWVSFNNTFAYNHYAPFDDEIEGCYDDNDNGFCDSSYYIPGNADMNPKDDYPVFVYKRLLIGESVDNTFLNWSVGGDLRWVGQNITYYYDNDSAISGHISDNQETWVQTTVINPGNLSFYWKVSSESCCDFLEFYINGSLNDSISGNIDWQKKNYTLESGNYTFKWRYIKDGSVAYYNDSAWLDKVSISSNPTPTPTPYSYINISKIENNKVYVFYNTSFTFAFNTYPEYVKAVKTYLDDNTTIYQQLTYEGNYLFSHTIENSNYSVYFVMDDNYLNGSISTTKTLYFTKNIESFSQSGSSISNNERITTESELKENYSIVWILLFFMLILYLGGKVV